ncbi:hypothetical protein Rhal01_02930 [Rubritalea halochordaticola]|uniref:SGNH hydrolase-type esterase domain-containing protein n=1 Tax=Rubritalea halochordaticola TaxID=714537 RepID=A0ABP9V428_9BACT
MIRHLSIILSACLLQTAFAEQIAPDDSRISYRGVLYPQVSTTHAEFLRFPPELLKEASPATHGFNPAKARFTAGASIHFQAKAPEITLQFEPEKFCKVSVFQNGTFDSIYPLKKDGSLTIKSKSPGQAVDFSIILPNFRNPLFKGISLQDGSLIKALPDSRSKTYVAIGDSITHGQGQDFAYQTWGGQVADKLGMNFYNLAVGGSNANAHLAKPTLELDHIELITILWGYNDWVHKGKSPEKFANDLTSAIKVIRSKHKDTPIVVLGMLNTLTETSKRTGEQYKADQFRKAAQALVHQLKSAGDQHIHFVDCLDMIDEKTDLRDKVHLSEKGATKLASKITPILKDILSQSKK